MKTTLAALFAFGLLSGVANARTVFDEIRDTAPRTVFDDIRETAPRLPFDEISATAPHSVFDQIRDSAPRSDGVFGELEKSAP